VVAQGDGVAQGLDGPGMPRPIPLSPLKIVIVPQGDHQWLVILTAQRPVAAKPPAERVTVNPTTPDRPDSHIPACAASPLERCGRIGLTVSVQRSPLPEITSRQQRWKTM